MSLYDAAKDALRLAQQADNVELVQKIIDVQAQALDMQEAQQKQNQTIIVLRKEVDKLKEMKKYDFADGENYLIDTDNPSRKLCPYCTRKHNIPVPLNDFYCRLCKGYFGE
jgi:hypothetical protein